MITEIELDKLYIHPGNVRKTYEGIDELADSIRAKGIMQNLTVVPGHLLTDEEWNDLAKRYKEQPEEDIRNRMNTKASGRWVEDGYTVVIGNRRLTAARQAGIRTAPCRVAEMDEKEQVSTMLLENMQRKDLNAYEESCGIQLCLDFGMTQKEISEKTGLSRQTIRHREKMQELDAELVKEKCGQATIADFIALEKIKDIEKRNEVLKSVGTNNFSYQLQRAVQEQEKEKIAGRIHEILDGFAEKAEKADPEWLYLRWMSGYIPETESYLKELAERQEDVHYHYTEDRYGIRLYRERTEEEQEEASARSAEEAQRQAEQEAGRQQRAKREELGRTLYAMRKSFVQEGNFEKLSQSDLAGYMAVCIVNGVLPWKEDDDGNMISDRGVEYLEFEERHYGEAEFADEVLCEAGKDPYRTMVKLAYAVLEEGQNLPCDYFGNYERDEQIEYLYKFLGDLGYVQSDEEVLVLTGKHPIFQEGGAAGD